MAKYVVQASYTVLCDEFAVVEFEGSAEELLKRLDEGEDELEFPVAVEKQSEGTQLSATPLEEWDGDGEVKELDAQQLS